MTTGRIREQSSHLGVALTLSVLERGDIRLVGKGGVGPRAGAVAAIERRIIRT